MYAKDRLRVCRILLAQRRTLSAVRKVMHVVGLLISGSKTRDVPNDFSREPNSRHFDGVVDHSHYTDDDVRSRLAVDAVRALERGDAKAAEELYRAMVSKYPVDPAAYVNLGVCLGYQERFDESRKQYLKALEFRPAFGRRLPRLGR